ncbi:hypothetical protein KL86APRO_10484 [uncultured Alphaproteobacteria bacterium]|uniref:Uncharacterized protein n=1 Tax=uncultured Alphaproteobacteria bacterium TaxID=91750 RepID=A0A212J493_9PROT|nr:hypothetical protein KL86APRO_10484 [uncultured Alphaproteobacteria bacterium]
MQPTPRAANPSPTWFYKATSRSRPSKPPTQPPPSVPPPSPSSRKPPEMLRSRRMPAAPLALALALFSTACGTVKPEPLIETRVEKVKPPRPLLTCAPDPAVPATNSDAAVADYLADLWSAGEDCRTRLACVRAWREGRATETCRLPIEDAAE